MERKKCTWDAINARDMDHTPLEDFKWCLHCALHRESVQYLVDVKTSQKEATEKAAADKAGKIVFFATLVNSSL